MADIPIFDRRGGHRNVDGNREMANLRERSFNLPNSDVHARIEARRVVGDIHSKDSQAHASNKAMATEMRRRRLESNRVSAGSGGGFSVRQGANVQMALPKVRQPMSSLLDKGIPFNVQDPEELIELRRWCRLFAVTHPLVPLLIEMYCRFPVMGLHFTCKDPQIQEFYEEMFLNDLNYEEFLPDGLLREYFTVGEVTTLSHFNERLGTWGSEEILNPDWVRVSKGLFNEEERVQLLVKDMVEQLRDGDPGMSTEDESPSERKQRMWEYQQLVQHYPEIVRAAQQDDGLDIADALVSRIVNRASWMDLRGTPYLLRSFRTLMLEESLHAAEDAICDRMYAPMVLATLGIEDMGGGVPWIPDQDALDELRDDIQNALAADFKVLVHNMGLQVTSVFGRESVPRFDTDYDRVDTQLMQSWGIGAGMIMGGSGAGGAYATTAVNREICENLMKGAQNKVKAHMRKKMMLIAEAQDHWDYELKGGVREAVYMEIEEFNEETEEMEIVRVPKPLVPDIEFDTLNMRDEATERAFLGQLKEYGVPISDGRLALNVPIDFAQELEMQAAETYAKGMAQAQVMDKLQKKLDADGLAYPAELVQFLQATLTLRAQMAETQLGESQNKLMDQQLAQSSPAGMLGLLPGTSMQPLPGLGMPGSIGADPSGQTLPPAQGGNPEDPTAEGGAQPASEGAPGATADPTLGAGAPAAAAPGMAMAASMHPPTMAPPGGIPESPTGGNTISKEPARNRMRPEQSDEMRDSMPKEGRVVRKQMIDKEGNLVFDAATGEPVMIVRGLSALEKGPSYYRGGRRYASESHVTRAVRRREVHAAGGLFVDTLVHDPNFWATVNMQAYQGQIQADWPEIQAGGARESRAILDEALEQYEEATGIEPRW